MKPISFLLILSLPAILIVIRNYNRIVGKVAARLFSFAFAVLLVIAVIFPVLTQRVAQLLGVGRGADLIFYATTMSLIAFAGITFVKLRSLEAQMTSLARAVALKDFLTSEGPFDLDR